MGEKTDNRMSSFTQNVFKRPLLQVFISTLYKKKKKKKMDVTKLKAFADDKLEVAKWMISFIDRVENTVGKGEMLVTRIFSKAVFKNLD